MNRRHAFALALALAFAPARLARAEPPRALADSLTDEARAAYDRARAAYAAGEFAAARAAFGRAHDLARDPRLFWNMAACERKLFHASKAIALIDRYVAAGGDLLTEADRSDAAQWRATLARAVGTLTIASAPAGGALYIDDEPAGTTPLAASILVDAGDRRVRFVLRGFHTIVRTEQVQAGAALSWSFAPARIKVRLVNAEADGGR